MDENELDENFVLLFVIDLVIRITKHGNQCLAIIHFSCAQIEHLIIGIGITGLFTMILRYD